MSGGRRAESACLAAPFGKSGIMDKNRLTGREVQRYFSRPVSGFQSSSMVEHAAVNRGVAGSSPASGAILTV